MDEFDDGAEHRSRDARFPPPSKYTNYLVGKGQPGPPDGVAQSEAIKRGAPIGGVGVRSAPPPG